MIQRTLLLIIPLLLSAIVVAQSAKPASDLQAMIDAERAFAATATQKGVRDSFLEFIADDGILYRPGPVNGKKWLTDRPARPGLLTWYPVYADISAAGDLGFTTGPWEFRPNGPEDTPVGFGQFASVWRKQSDGTWKFVNDLGIDHGKPGNKADQWKMPDGFVPAKPPKQMDPAQGKKEILALEAKFSAASQKKGMAVPFADYAAENIRALRNGTFPAIGFKEAVAFEALRTGSRSLSWVPADSGISTSGDFGFTYGSYELKGDGRSPAESGNYLRVWKKQKNGKWKIVLDVLSVIPK